MKVEKQIAMDFKTIQEEVSHFIVLGDSANQAKWCLRMSAYPCKWN